MRAGHTRTGNKLPPAGPAPEQSPDALRDHSSVAGYDLPDDLSLSASWEMLLGRGRLIDVRNEPALSLVSGWRINQVSAETSGMPFTITTSGGFVKIGNRNEDRGEWVGKAR